MVLIAVLGPRSGSDDDPDPTTQPTLSPTATPSPPEAPATATPTLEFPELGTVWVEDDGTGATQPSPTPTSEPEPDRIGASSLQAPTPVPPVPTRPGPRPTLSLPECLALTWGSTLSPSAPGQILVEIEVYNRCGRDLEAMDVWFTVQGRRDGSTVQMVRGHLFDPLRDGQRATTTIGLPGSPDFYDEIQVDVLP
jgi:hypothetical protein